MNRISIAALVLAASASTAFADDITIDTTPFVPVLGRAEVQAELASFKQSGLNVWSNQYNPVARFSSQRSRADVVAEYLAARREVAALTAEDSGSAALAQRGTRAAATRVAGQPTQAH